MIPAAYAGVGAHAASASRRRCIAILALLLLAPSALALTDRADFEKWCTQGSSVAAGRCLGYLLAAEDALAGNSIDNVRACLPRNIDLAEQRRIVMDWLRAHPQATAPTAMGLLARAYAASYPCPP